MKINHRALWGRAAELMETVERARLSGRPVSCDVYPYTAGSGGLKNSLPYWVQEGGITALLARLREPSTRTRIRTEVLDAMQRQVYHIGAWDNVVIGYSPAHPEFHGLNLSQIAARADRAAVDAYLDLILADKGGTISIHFMMNEADVRTFMRHPSMVIGSDGIFRGVAGKPDPGTPHPRHFGTFPRILGHYTRDGQVFELAEAIRKMTSASADILGLKDRGRLKPGAIADVVIFDPQAVADTATFAQPQQAPLGIEHVLVNGVAVVSAGVLTGATPGKVLRKR
jgi:N-acyl-D-aspartate/D-glutamate deacylase